MLSHFLLGSRDDRNKLPPFFRDANRPPFESGSIARIGLPRIKTALNAARREAQGSNYSTTRHSRRLMLSPRQWVRAVAGDLDHRLILSRLLLGIQNRATLRGHLVHDTILCGSRPRLRQACAAIAAVDRRGQLRCHHSIHRQKSDELTLINVAQIQWSICPNRPHSTKCFPPAPWPNVLLAAK